MLLYVAYASPQHVVGNSSCEHDDRERDPQIEWQLQFAVEDDVGDGRHDEGYEQGGVCGTVDGARHVFQFAAQHLVVDDGLPVEFFFEELKLAFHLLKFVVLFHIV